MESGIEGLEFNDKKNSWGPIKKPNIRLETLFNILAYICLFIGVLATVELIIRENDAFMFFLLGGVSSFAVFRAFALFVKAAKKYLNR